jgi:hypothetical protein
VMMMIVVSARRKRGERCGQCTEQRDPKQTHPHDPTQSRDPAGVGAGLLLLIPSPDPTSPAPRPRRTSSAAARHRASG